MAHSLSAVLNDATSRARVKQQLARLLVPEPTSSPSASAAATSPSAVAAPSPAHDAALSAYRRALAASLAPAASERVRGSETGADVGALVAEAHVPLSERLRTGAPVPQQQRTCAETLDRVEDALSAALTARAGQLWALLRRLHALHRTLLAVLPLLLALRTRLLDAHSAYVALAYATQRLRSARGAHEAALKRLNEHEELEAACAAIEVLLLHGQDAEALRLLTQRAEALPELARALGTAFVRAVLSEADAEAQRVVDTCSAAGEDALLALADAAHTATLHALIPRPAASDTPHPTSTDTGPEDALDTDALTQRLHSALERLRCVERGASLLREAGAAVRAQALLVAACEGVAATLSATLRHAALLDHATTPESAAQVLTALAELARSAESWQAPRATATLRTAALSLGRTFVETLHAHALQALSSSLDAEPWTPTAVPTEYQRLLDDIIVPSAADADSTASGASSSDAESTALRLPDARVVTPCASLLLLLKRTHVLLRCSAQFASSWRALAADAARLLGELLHAFNARAYALVLRQGALQTGALKGVAVRHLAQVAATLDVVLALVRSLRATHATRFGSGVEARLLHEQYSQLLTHVEQHSQQLMDKFVALMVERAVLVAPALLTAPLDAEKEKGALGLRELEKKVVVLHKALCSALSPFQTRTVLVRVLSEYRRILRETLASPPPGASLDAARKQRLCDEARALDITAVSLLKLDAHEALAVALLPVVEAAPLGSLPNTPDEGGMQAAQRLLSSLGWDTS